MNLKTIRLVQMGAAALFFAGAQFAFATTARAGSGLEGIVRIEVGRNDGNVSNDELRRRVWELERAVQQLQMRVFSLEVTGAQRPASVPAEPAQPKVTCFIKTPFDGTFSATESTETAAKAAAMEKCSTKVKVGFHCEEDRVKCGK